MNQKTIYQYLNNIILPKSDSHKGENGNLLVIGGSKLFHAACKWSLDVASRFVDMVYFSSDTENNELIQRIKSEFWNGIVIPHEEIEAYIEKSDCILIGPGMDRSAGTQKVTNNLLKKYQNKKWVIDAGALQMADPKFLGKTHIITPHKRELTRLEENGFNHDNFEGTMLLKGRIDILTNKNIQKIEIEGGNPGMTKGGTGDVLAGLIAALYTTHDTITAAFVGSYINKKAGGKLAGKVGPYFNASDLVESIPITMWEELKKIDIHF